MGEWGGLSGWKEGHGVGDWLPRGSWCVGGRSPSRSRGRVGSVRRMWDAGAEVVSLRGQQEGGNSYGRGLVGRVLVT